jgi:hypothetical protein
MEILIIALIATLIIDILLLRKVQMAIQGMLEKTKHLEFEVRRIQKTIERKNDDLQR